MNDVGVIIAAAGVGRRFGGRKQFLELLGKPILHYSLEVFTRRLDVGAIILVLPPEDLLQGSEMLEKWKESLAPGDFARLPAIELAGGGARRQDSVMNGIHVLPESARYVLVHDAARPLLRPGDVARIIAATRDHGAAAIGVPSSDSVKRVRGGKILEELPRDEVWTVQTPQSARVELLCEAYDRGMNVEMTDEASALRAIGVDVRLVEGSRENIKITRPGDETLAEMILRARRPEN